MKSHRVLIRLFTAFVLSLFTASLASAFEGQVTMKMTTGKDAQTMTYYVKGAKMRMEFTPEDKKNARNGTMAMIADWEKKEMIVLMPDQKMYLVRSLADVEEMAQKQQADFKPTGRKEKIAGYDAEEYVGTSDGKRIEVWTTKGLGKFLMGHQGGRGQNKVGASIEKFMRENEFFALRTIQRAKEGAKEDFRMEVVNVDKTPQNEAHFTVPKEFQRMDVPNMGGMLKGMIPGNR